MTSPLTTCWTGTLAGIRERFFSNAMMRSANLLMRSDSGAFAILKPRIVRRTCSRLVSASTHQQVGGPQQVALGLVGDHLDEIGQVFALH